MKKHEYIIELNGSDGDAICKMMLSDKEADLIAKIRDSMKPVNEGDFIPYIAIRKC